MFKAGASWIQDILDTHKTFRERLGHLYARGMHSVVNYEQSQQRY